MAYGLEVQLPQWDAAFSIVVVNMGLLLMICLVSGSSIAKDYIHSVLVRARTLLELIFIQNGLFYLNLLDFDIQFSISYLCSM